MSDDLYPRLGQEVRQIRERLGLTQADLADRVQLSRSSIANIEAGRQAVYVHQLIALARALGRSAGDLLAIAEPPKPAVAAGTEETEETEETGEDELQKLIRESVDFPGAGGQ